MHCAFILYKSTDLVAMHKKSLSQIFTVLSSESRLRALELFGEKEDLTKIAMLIKMSRSGFQKIVDQFRNLGLIERTGHRSVYRLSNKGIEILKALKDFDKKIESIKKLSNEEQLERILARFGAGLSREEILRIAEKAGVLSDKN